MNILPIHSSSGDFVSPEPVPLFQPVNFSLSVAQWHVPAIENFQFNEWSMPLKTLIQQTSFQTMFADSLVVFSDNCYKTPRWHVAGTELLSDAGYWTKFDAIRQSGARDIPKRGLRKLKNEMQDAFVSTSRKTFR